MHDHERKDFAEAMNQLFAIYGDEVTNRLRDAWWGVLSPYRLSAVMAAMNLHAGDVQRGSYRPTPADICKHLEVTIPGMIAERRNRIVREARSRIAPLQEAIAQLDSDVKIGARDAEYAAVEREQLEYTIRGILAEPDCVMAMAPQASLLEEQIGPRDRLPSAVRRALGWLGKPRG
ncbi:MAG: hypothetical protein V4641_05470 [Pseudomonadota bacterium]